MQRLKDYGPVENSALIGTPVDQLGTPALVVRRDALARNVDAMAARTSGPVRLRPHFKTHKSVELARMQLDAGAIGITVATVWEAQALAGAGVESVLIANEVIGASKLRVAGDVAGMCRLTVAVDSATGADQLSAAMRAAGTAAQALVDVDVGMGRCGVRTTGEALALAERLQGLAGVELVGVMGYEGHCVLEPDDGTRREQAGAAVDRLAAVADALREPGHRIDVVSAGGTGTASFTGADARVTDIQAGSYVFMDAAYERVVGDFDVTLYVLATVISRHADTAVLDCGVKTIATSLATPRLAAGGGAVRYVAEEHTVVELEADAGLAVGDQVEVVTGHCCETVNLHDRLYVVQDDVVVDVWPIMGRGPGGVWE